MTLTGPGEPTPSSVPPTEKPTTVPREQPSYPQPDRPVTRPQETPTRPSHEPPTRPQPGS
ncbi:MAG: hypothetical protein IPF95_06205 [Flavobacteriales bacterium]|nr:hypothetical protein [Flavobacteriales bacterium]MBK6943975.1 hypothetical protein [Flavobacteriales bacterium]MBK7297865.1 hypothetical protein [Flavobacteriales bacterium]